MLPILNGKVRKKILLEYESPDYEVKGSYSYFTIETLSNGSKGFRTLLMNDSNHWKNFINEIINENALKNYFSINYSELPIRISKQSLTITIAASPIYSSLNNNTPMSNRIFELDNDSKIIEPTLCKLQIIGKDQYEHIADKYGLDSSSTIEPVGISFYNPIKSNIVKSGQPLTIHGDINSANVTIAGSIPDESNIAYDRDPLVILSNDSFLKILKILGEVSIFKLDINFQFWLDYNQISETGNFREAYSSGFILHLFSPKFSEFLNPVLDLEIRTRATQSIYWDLSSHVNEKIEKLAYSGRIFDLLVYFFWLPTILIAFFQVILSLKRFSANSSWGKIENYLLQSGIKRSQVFFNRYLFIGSTLLLGGILSLLILPWFGKALGIDYTIDFQSFVTLIIFSTLVLLIYDYLLRRRNILVFEDIPLTKIPSRGPLIRGITLLVSISFVFFVIILFNQFSIILQKTAIFIGDRQLVDLIYKLFFLGFAFLVVILTISYYKDVLLSIFSIINKSVYSICKKKFYGHFIKSAVRNKNIYSKYSVFVVIITIIMYSGFFLTNMMETNYFTEESISFGSDIRIQDSFNNQTQLNSKINQLQLQSNNDNLVTSPYIIFIAKIIKGNQFFDSKDIAFLAMNFSQLEYFEHTSRQKLSEYEINKTNNPKLYVSEDLIDSWDIKKGIIDLRTGFSDGGYASTNKFEVIGSFPTVPRLQALFQNPKSSNYQKIDGSIVADLNEIFPLIDNQTFKISSVEQGFFVWKMDNQEKDSLLIYSQKLRSNGYLIEEGPNVIGKLSAINNAEFEGLTFFVNFFTEILFIIYILSLPILPNHQITAHYPAYLSLLQLNYQKNKISRSIFLIGGIEFLSISILSLGLSLIVSFAMNIVLLEQHFTINPLIVNYNFFKGNVLPLFLLNTFLLLASLIIITKVVKFHWKSTDYQLSSNYS
ncbi:MAG: hypothetical protein HeimC3_02550 [Candidatus Heimdallarchaeota archaeon LC_3]|nr:MAG: hypothetical protein HeimC3_02550 [Candidatus Heimdallarchaeota archaeon LC_3]